MTPGIVYSYVNHIGDVAFCVRGRDGVIREVVDMAGGLIAWKPAELGLAGRTIVGLAGDEGIAFAWMVGA